MAVVLPIALVLLADGAAYGPTAPVQPKPPVAKPASDDSCAKEQQAKATSRDIVICAQRTEGYRLDPDIVEARKEKRAIDAGRLKTPAEKMAETPSCTSVGPMGCRGQAGVNLLAAALTAVEMAKRLAQGQEIGSMFETTPQPDEYHLYLDAKHRREAKEAQDSALAKAKAAKAAAILAAKAEADKAAATAAQPAPAAHP